MSMEFIEEAVVFGKKEKYKWISVKDRLPEDDTSVLVFGGKSMYIAQCFNNGKSWYRIGTRNHYCNPTHWMPLPNPPDKEN